MKKPLGEGRREGRGRGFPSAPHQLKSDEGGRGMISAKSTLLATARRTIAKINNVFRTGILRAECQ